VGREAGTVAVLVEEAERLLELRDLLVGELVRHGRGRGGLRRGHATRKETREGGRWRHSVGWASLRGWGTVAGPRARFYRQRVQARGKEEDSKFQPWFLYPVLRPFSLSKYSLFCFSFSLFKNGLPLALGNPRSHIPS
jgi:hypothetical protein